MHNGVCYLAGQVAADASQDVADQTAQVLQSIDALLERAGSDKSRLLMCQIYLCDETDFDAMNAEWETWVVPGQAPPRATVSSRNWRSRSGR